MSRCRPRESNPTPSACEVEAVAIARRHSSITMKLRYILPHSTLGGIFRDSTDERQICWVENITCKVGLSWRKRMSGKTISFMGHDHLKT